MQDENCIFCKIAVGKISSRILTQNDKAIAFLDAFPLAAGHTLVIPKSHYSKVQEMSEQDATALFEITCRVAGAVEAGSLVNASLIAIHNGKDAGQEIPHVHVHVIPRKRDDGAGAVHSMFKTRPKLSSQEMDALCKKVVDTL